MNTIEKQIKERVSSVDFTVKEISEILFQARDIKSLRTFRSLVGEILSRLNDTEDDILEELARYRAIALSITVDCIGKFYSISSTGLIMEMETGTPWDDGSICELNEEIQEKFRERMPVRGDYFIWNVMCPIEYNFKNPERIFWSWVG